MDRIGKIISWNIQSREEGKKLAQKAGEGRLSPCSPLSIVYTEPK